MSDDQLDRFGEAVEQKNEEAKAKSEQAGEENPAQPAIEGDQTSVDERAKSSRDGQVTADKWNQ